MILVFGGAYQGKRNWVKAEFGFEDEQIFVCRKGDPSLKTGKPAIDGLHRAILAMITEGRDPVAEMAGQIESLKDKVIICEDITGGVVPMNADMRAWREGVGRCMGLLSAEAEAVYRIFCGLPMRLK